MATVIFNPTTPDLASKLRILQGTRRAYGHELAYLNREHQKGTITQDQYDACVNPILNDIDVLEIEIDALKSQLPKSPEAPIEGLHTPAPANSNNLFTAKN